MKYIIAVSGGVDSVVLLDIIYEALFRNDTFVKLPNDLRKDNLIVAHFDHGIRPESSDDAIFVESLAKKYGMSFKLGEANLGKNANEESARKARYKFFRSVISGSDPKIITAHHQDDLIETILMNLMRGTGWRGLAPFWSNDILRPLINMDKAEITRYAIEHDLEWVEDETNYSSKYFRNRIRNVTSTITPKDRQKLLKLQQKQVIIRNKVEGTIIPTNIHNDENLSQSFVNKLPEAVAVEVLRSWTNSKLTIPQLKKLQESINKAQSGDIIQPGGGVQIALYRDNMMITTLMN